jgi:hypothetical protein
MSLVLLATVAGDDGVDAKCAAATSLFLSWIDGSAKEEI